MFSFYLAGFRKILNITKKIFLVIAVYFIIISLFGYFLAKDKPKLTEDPVKKKREEIYKVINDKELNNTPEGKLAITLYRGMLCGMIGEACTNNPADAEKNFNHSLFGFISNLIILPYANPPASGVYWAYSGLQNAGFIPKTYAAEGIGFAAIRPFMNIWKVFRDISYMLLVLVLIAIGFMIMFRAKINPQTVISVENALPKIVVALLLITFSFPIAGFLIDFMYIIIGIIAVFFSKISGAPSEINTPQKILDLFYFEKQGGILFFLNPTSNISNLWSLGGSLYNILPDILKNLINTMLLIIFPPDKVLYLLLSLFGVKTGLFSQSGATLELFKNFLRIFPKFKENLQNTSTPVVGMIIAVIIFLIDIIILAVITPYIAQFFITLILVLTFLYIFLRIFFILLYSYIQIILLIFFAPVILSIEMIPGKSTFSSWVKNLLVNLSTWPFLTILFLINKILLNQSIGSTAFWQPPFLISINSKDIAIIISMGILFLIPDLIKTLKDLLGVKPLPLGLNLGAFTAGAGAVIGGGLGAVGQFYTPYQFLIAPQTGILRSLFKIKDVKEGGEKVAENLRSSPGAGPATSPPSD